MWQVIAISTFLRENVNFEGTEEQCERFRLAQQQFLPREWRLIVRKVQVN